MTIVLAVLKILGIILLTIILIILTLLLLVLFVPIRYRLCGRIDTKQDIAVDIKGKVTWLLHFVNAIASYSDKFFYRFRVTFITLVSSERKVKVKKETRKKKKECKTETIKEEDTSNTVEETSEELLSESDYTIDWNGEEKTEDFLIDTGDDEDESDKSIEEIPKRNLFEKITDFLIKLKDLFDDALNGFQKTGVKIQSIINNIDYYIDAIQDERNKTAFSLCIREVKKILKNIKPKVFKGQLHYGSDDPSSVGRVLAISGALYPLIEDNFTVTGNFESDELNGNILIIGRVTVFVLLKAAWILYFNKDIRRMTKMLKREE